MPERHASFPLQGRRPWFGVLLILVGIALLLDKLLILHFGFARIVWASILLFGIFQVVQGFSRNRSGRIFWGTLLFLYGVYFLIRTFEFFEFRSHLFVPASLIIFGVALLMTYLNNLKEWFLLVPSLLLSGLGTAILLGQLWESIPSGEVYDLWEIWLPIRKYWPAILILVGLALIISNQLKRQKMS